MKCTDEWRGRSHFPAKIPIGKRQRFGVGDWWTAQRGGLKGGPRERCCLPPSHVNKRGACAGGLRVFSSHARYLLSEQGPGFGLEPVARRWRRHNKRGRPSHRGLSEQPRWRFRMAEDSPKRRKANFNEAETEVLIEQVLKHEQVLFAAGPGRASPGQKRKVWELIRHKVNPVAACPREVEDLKKRWRDLKRRDRSKLCRVSHGAGGVAPHPASFGLLMGNEDASPPDHLRSYPSGLPAPNEAVPIVGGIDTLDLPRASSVTDMGFTDDPGPSQQPCLEKINLKEEIVVKVVEPEESSEDMAVVPPSQEQLPFWGINGGLCGKVKAKTKTQPQTDSNEIIEEDLLQIQQNQLHIIQSGFDSINHNLRLLHQGMQDLNNSLSVMAHTLVAIKNVYVKNNAGPTTFATVTTQTTAGYLSPGSPLVEDRVRVPVAGSSSRSSSCSSSSMSQEPGPSEFPRPPHRPIKKEHSNGCYYFCFADV